MKGLPERTLHKKLVGLLRDLQKDKNFIFFHVRNEMGKNRYNPEALGILAGAADFTILMERRAILLEIKTEKGRLSNEQKIFLSRVNEMGHTGVVAFGWDDICDKVDTIFRGDKRSAKAKEYGRLPGKVIWVDRKGKIFKRRGEGKVSVFLY